MLYALLFACESGSGQPEPGPAAPAEPNPAPVASAAPAPATDAPSSRPTFACCDSVEATAILTAYLGVNDALSRDTDASEAIEALVTNAQGPAPEVSKGLAGLAGKPISDQRAAIKAQSTAIITYLKAHTGGSQQVAVAYCPMQDASWVQAGATVANPYYGSEMLTCGYFKE
jgi:hypothetical protein